MSPPEQLWSLSATQLAAAYRDGLDPRDALASTLERVARINPYLNAIITLDTDGALVAADRSAKRWQDGKPLGPFDGIPITVKDSILARGLRATWGSRLYEHHVADSDEEPVRRLRDGGAVLLGKTNVPELTVQGYTDNELFGVTRNPWDTNLTPGGSSGGAVTAVASGMGALALATDGGGSIRRPCAHTGLVGLKPTRGAVPRGSGFPVILHDFEVIGAIARCAADVRLALSAIADLPDARFPDDRQLRIGFAPTFGDAPVDPIIATAADRMAQRMAQDGHHVERLDTFDLADPIARVWPVISQTGVAGLLSQHDNAFQRISPAIRDMALAGQGFSAGDFADALAIIAATRPVFDAFFARYDLLMTPTTAAMPWPASDVFPAHINGKDVGPRGHAVFTPFANALGLPALSLPCDVGPQVLPIGVQLCAAWGRDMALLAFAEAYETPFRFPSDVSYASAATTDVGKNFA